MSKTYNRRKNIKEKQSREKIIIKNKLEYLVYLFIFLLIFLILKGGDWMSKKDIKKSNEKKTENTTKRVPVSRMIIVGESYNPVASSKKIDKK